MRVFSASMATESNSYAPLPTALSTFHDRTYIKAGEHPDRMQMFAGPLWAAREKGRALGWTLIEGVVAAALPNGIVTRHAYEALRAELLEDLERALPVDMILLGLHGAMVADGYDDCEGDLLERIRARVGPDVVIGATFDPHAHLSDLMVEKANLLIGWKEYPHTDVLDRARELVDLCAATVEGRIRPRASVVDPRMVALIYTTEDAGRRIVRLATELEEMEAILSVSIIQGFAWADVPAMGSKALVYSDEAADPDGGRRRHAARTLADAMFAARDDFAVPLPSIDDAIDQALATEGTVILGDGADNPGGGAPGDSTFILRRLVERGVQDACLAPMWDVGAVRIAFDAGIGATLPMRIGGKSCPLSGDPLDVTCTVSALQRDMIMTGLAGTPAKLGDCALVDVEGIAVVLTSIRCQAFGTDIFTQLGCDPSRKGIVVVKSTQHFKAAFAPLASLIIHVGAPGVVTSDIASLGHRRIDRPKWPIDR